MTHPPCLRLCPAYPGNPRNRIEGESPQLRKGHTVFVASLLAMTMRVTRTVLYFTSPRRGEVERSEGEGVRMPEFFSSVRTPSPQPSPRARVRACTHRGAAE